MPIFLMAIMNCTTFLLPTSSGERVGYAVSVMLAFGVFLTLMGEKLPKKSVPMSLMSWYLLALLIICACTCAMAIINTTLYHRENTQPVPNWIAFCAEKLTCLTFKFACKKGRVNHFDAESKDVPNKSPTDYERQKCAQDDNNKIESIEFAEHSCDGTNLKDDRMNEDKAITWKTVSETLDRVCFVLVTLVTVVCIITYIVLIPMNVSGTDVGFTRAEDYYYDTNNG